MDTQPARNVDDSLNALSRVVVDAMYTVHKAIGPGLLESVYETCLLYELNSRGVPVESQVHLPLIYRSVKIDAGLRLDMLVDQRLLIELKAVESIIPVHHAQIISYLRLANLNLGLLVNFNVPKIKEGIHRFVR